MTSDDIKAVEQRGYAKGYAAGRRRLKADRSAEHARRERQAFLDKAFLAALPFAMTQTTWKFGDEPINSSEDRIALAWRIAKRAMNSRERP